MRRAGALLLLALVACASPTRPPTCPVVSRDTVRDSVGTPLVIVIVSRCAPAPLPLP